MYQIPLVSPAGPVANVALSSLPKVSSVLRNVMSSQDPGADTMTLRNRWAALQYGQSKRVLAACRSLCSCSRTLGHSSLNIISIRQHSSMSILTFWKRAETGVRSPKSCQYSLAREYVRVNYRVGGAEKRVSRMPFTRSTSPPTTCTCSSCRPDGYRVPISAGV